MPMRNRTSERGFTLTELIATLALLGLMVLISVPIMDNVLSDSEDKVNDATIDMIEASAKVAADNGVLHDEPHFNQFKVRTLIESGHLASDDASILDHWVFENDKGTYTYYGERKESPESHFTFAPVTNEFVQRYAETTSDPEPLSGLEVTGYSGPGGEVVIPETVNGQPVVRIAHSAFNVNKITAVYMPESMRYIDGQAFNTNELVAVYLPDDLRRLDGGIFRNNNLTEVTLPAKLEVLGPNIFRENKIEHMDMGHLTLLKHISTYAFRGEPLQSINFPPNLESVGPGAFEEAELTSIVFPNSVTQIQFNSFRGNNLRSVTIPPNVGEVEAHAFSRNGMRSVRLSPGTHTYGKNAFHENELDELIIPEGAKYIGMYAFYENNIKKLELPEGLLELQGATFRSNQIGFVRIPSSLQSMGNYEFMSNNFGRVSNYSTAIPRGASIWSDNPGVEFVK